MQTLLSGRYIVAKIIIYSTEIKVILFKLRLCNIWEKN